jgi:hypothetical protein
MKTRKLLLFIMFSFLAQWSWAQSYTYADAWGENGFSVTSQKANKTVINYSMSSFSLTDIDINGDMMKNIQLPGTMLPNDEGAPNLPGMGRYVALPQEAVAELVVTNYRKEVIQNVEIAPAPRIPKDDESGPLHYEKDPKIYNKNANYPAEPFRISAVEQIRGVDVVKVGVTPFQYNPVTKELTVYRDVELEVRAQGGTGHIGEDRLRSRWFDPILEDALLNNTILPEINYSKRLSNSGKDVTGCEYLIISPDGDEFQQWADSIREFRTMQGILTQVVTLSEIGANNPDVLEDYFDNAYNTWDIPPVAVLLLGDHGTSMTNQVVSPIYDNYCVSDNLYADVTGNHMPDIVFARMTAQNETHLETMVTKAIHYEKNPPTSANFYDNPITALGWQTERWFQICSESINGFWRNNLGKNPVRENVLYSGSTSSWSTATNTSTVVNYFGPNGTGYIESTPNYILPLNGSSQGVTDALNAGAFMLQHRDHGGETGWGEPNWGINNINSLTNTDLSFIMSINCLTGKFNYSGECFAEKFHRYTYNGEPAGALGLIAASEVSYSFVNDTYVWGLYDNMWPDFLPDYGSTPEERGVLPAFGNAAGKYFLEQSSWPYNTNNKEVTYYLFHHHGDAFTSVYSEVPQNLTVIHNDVLLSGPDFFEVTADAGSLIALSVDGELIGTAEGTGAPVDITIEPLLPGETVDVVVTKQNYFRYHQQVMVIPPDGPYVIKNSFELDDSDGNGNGMADYGESVGISLMVENVGNEAAEDVTVTLATDDPYVTLTDDTEFYGTIPAGETLSIDNGFYFEVADSIPDNHMVVFNVLASGTENWSSSISTRIFAPVINIGAMSVTELEGNGNGRLDPGETAMIHIAVENSGHAAAMDVASVINSTSPELTITSGETTFDVIDAESGVEALFSIAIDGSTAIGTLVTLNNIVDATPYYASKTFGIKVGLIIEDFETGDFTQFDWLMGGDSDWEISDSEAFEGVYSAASGDIGDNQTSEFEIDYNVMFDDTISFYYKVSSETNYDFLNFFIDGSQRAAFSGQTDWQQIKFPVSEGPHNFKWVYDKDYSMNSGQDKAWVDYIILPPELATTAFAGPNQHGCGTTPIELTGASATYYNAVQWATDGTGYFSDDLILNPIYYPSQEDADAGMVTLTLYVFGEEGDNVSDEVEVYLHSNPEVSGVANAEICAGEVLTVEGLDAANYSNFTWTTDGDGYFDDSTALMPQYTPGTAETAAGEAVIHLTVGALGMCSDTTVDMTITIHALPTATGLSGDYEVCENDIFEITSNLTGTAPYTVEMNGMQFEVPTDVMSHQASIVSDTSFMITSVTDANGCTNIVEGEANITMHALPTAVVNAGDYQLCENTVFEFRTDLTGTAPYTLTINGTEFIAEADSLLQNIPVTNDTILAVSTVVDANGCENTGSGQVVVTMDPLPVAAAIPAGADTVDLVYNTTSDYTVDMIDFADSYIWTLSPEEAGTLIVDAQNITITWADGWTGTATLSVMGSNDCGIGESNFKEILVVNTIGIEENALSNVIRLYPNPSSGMITLTALDGFDEPVTIRVMDALSEIVLVKQNIRMTDEQHLDLHAFGKGVYFIIIETSKQQAVKRVIIR